MISPASFDELQSICYRGTSVDGINHRHWRTGEILTTAISPHTPRHLQEGRTSRVALHRVLMNEVPEGVFRYGKQVVHVEKSAQEDGAGMKMQLSFADGSSRDADVVVAADGLYSVSTNPPPSHVPYCRSSMCAKTPSTPENPHSISSRFNGQISWPCLLPSYRALGNHTAYQRLARRYIILAKEWGGSIHVTNRLVWLPLRLSWLCTNRKVFIEGTGGYSFTCMVIEPPEYAASLRWAKSIVADGLQRLREHHFSVCCIRIPLLKSLLY